jgi:transaldolase
MCYSEIAYFKPSEGTTNPSLLYQAAQLPKYAGIVQRSVAYAQSLDESLSKSQRLNRAAEYLAVEFGVEIYKLTGGISTEADVAISFDVSATIDAALRIIELYRQHGIPKGAVRIKISATWEGIQAARVLEKEHGISVLITVVFGITQAIAAAEVGVGCIAPYVGRIGDWHKANDPASQASGLDMGVEKVKEMQNYLRKYGFKTKVMGASFRNTEQVISLAGIDYLTIAPAILKQLEEKIEDVPAQVTAETGMPNFVKNNCLAQTRLTFISLCS